MDGRLQRYTIPATIVLMCFIITIFVGAQFVNKEVLWDTIKTLQSTGLIALLVAIGLTNYGLGYICHVLFSAWMFWRRKGRLVDPQRLCQIYKVPIFTKATVPRKITNVLMADFHFRLHSSQNESLISHFSRRNSGWFITKSSAIAILIGGLGGFICIRLSENLVLDQSWFLGWVVVSLILFGISWYAGSQWNREFWETAWRWLEEDLYKFPLRDSVKQEIDDLRKKAGTSTFWNRYLPAAYQPFSQQVQKQPDVGDDADRL